MTTDHRVQLESSLLACSSWRSSSAVADVLIGSSKFGQSSFDDFLEERVHGAADRAGNVPAVCARGGGGGAHQGLLQGAEAGGGEEWKVLMHPYQILH
ncbi:hypothetical protein AMTR_s00236p00014620 [Amborella trichopoda]|uniref:Uncharacterized protein n=1 Tax=Amborella trichopoda TaxID=13333 RepID=W1NUB9_AMBTC|nr:hypothetical protein AMTR_s00236p00014620 [Amborella trichopoda]